MNLNETLKNLRQEHNLLQKELAPQLHLTISTLSNYETGKHNHSILLTISLEPIIRTSLQAIGSYLSPFPVG